MTKWGNFVLLAAPRNGTAVHTANPTTGTVVAGSLFTPTVGNQLYCISAGAVVSPSGSGWTQVTVASNFGSLSVHTKVAQATNDFTTTHDGSNYPCAFAFFEFGAGTTVVKATQTQNINATTFSVPALTALTPPNLTIGIVDQVNPSTTGATSSVLWSVGTELYDTSTPNVSSTDGYTTSLAYVEDDTATSRTFSGAVAASAGNLNVEVIGLALSVVAMNVVSVPLLSETGAKLVAEDGTTLLMTG